MLFQRQTPIKVVTTAIVECNGSPDSPESRIGEAIANATAAAVEMARLGMPAKDVVVPVVSTTGKIVQVAAVYMLEPSLPVVCFVTHDLLLSKAEDRVKAAQVFVAMAQHADKVETFFAGCIQSNTLTPQPNITMRYDSEIYHAKLIKNFFSCCGERMEDASILRLFTEPSASLTCPLFACLLLSV
jgi:hypothetical protein